MEPETGFSGELRLRAWLVRTDIAVLARGLAFTGRGCWAAAPTTCSPNLRCSVLLIGLLSALGRS
jgi:hypothetical protein